MPVETSQQRSGGSLAERTADGSGRREPLEQSEEARGNRRPESDRPGGATLSHSFTGDDGETILIEETSGAAFAEATADPREIAYEQPRAARGPNMLLWLGAGLVVGLAGHEAWTRFRARPSGRRRHAVAFALDQTDPENFAQTRNAGPCAMRDPARERWDAVDEASDESFPASDPPGYA